MSPRVVFLILSNNLDIFQKYVLTVVGIPADVNLVFSQKILLIVSKVRVSAQWQIRSPFRILVKTMQLLTLLPF